MTSRFRSPPPEIEAITDVALLAPAFQAVVERILARLADQGFRAKVAETIRSAPRQTYLYGFGRDYDDGRGIVTESEDALSSWHGYGLAVDIIHATLEWGAPTTFWAALQRAAMAEGMTSGADWNRNGLADERFCDRPHVQWYVAGMHVTPSDHARALVAASGIEAVWRELEAA